MGVYDEAKIHATGLQCRVNHVYEAGKAIEKDSTNKIAKLKFKIMYATLENLATDLETQLQVIIRQQCKGPPGPDPINTEKIRAAFEEKYVGCKIYGDELFT